MRSRSRWNSLRPCGAASRRARPRVLCGLMAYGASSAMNGRGERLFQRVRRNVGCKKRGADRAQENETDFSALDFLVDAHQLHVTLEAEIGCGNRQTGASKHSDDS